MMRRTRVQKQRVLIFGLGIFGGGASAARWFAQRGAEVRVTDLRTAAILAHSRHSLKGLPVKYILGKHRSADVDWADLIIKNPGVPENQPLIRRARRLGVPIETDTAIFFQHCPAPVVAVTGTKGKSTTATLAALFIKSTFPTAGLGGNMGIPLLDMLPYTQAGVPFVTELSSWQIEGLTPHHLSPHIGIITNVLPDHLNRYRSFEHYAAVKQSLVAWQQPGDVAIVNGDNLYARATPISAGVTRHIFSVRNTRGDAGVDTRGFFLRQGGRRAYFARLGDLRIPGAHFQSAVLAAALAARANGADPRQFASVLRKFRGLQGRLQTIRTTGGVTWVNDTTATAPVATLAALNAFTQPLILIAGGVDKDLPMELLARQIRRRAKAVILLPGSGSTKLASALGRWPHRKEVASMQEAVKTAAAQAIRGDVVLLSPAAASFNLFRNEFDRGDAFDRAVKAL